MHDLEVQLVHVLHDTLGTHKVDLVLLHPTWNRGVLHPSLHAHHHVPCLAMVTHLRQDVLLAGFEIHDRGYAADVLAETCVLHLRVQPLFSLQKVRVQAS